MDGITQRLNAIVAGDTAQCEALYNILGDSTTAIIDAIKTDDHTASKIVHALSKIADRAAEAAHQSLLICACQWICLDAECTDILLDHGLVQAMQLLLEHVVLVSLDQDLRYLALALIKTVSFDYANGFKRSGRILASKRFCSLLGIFIRKECQAGLDGRSVDAIGSLIKCSFGAQTAKDIQAGEELDRKLGNILTWLIAEYKETTDKMLSLLLTWIIGSHEYATARVVEAGAIQQVVEQAQGSDEDDALDALGVMWNGSDGVPGARHLVTYCAIFIKIMRDHQDDIASEYVLRCVGILANLTRCKIAGHVHASMWICVHSPRHRCMNRHGLLV
jgi:hypothetical protein